jgi:hypothetical protein
MQKKKKLLSRYRLGVCARVCVFVGRSLPPHLQFQPNLSNQLTEFHETLHQIYGIEGYINILNIDFPQSVLITWRTRGLVRRELC